MPLRRTTTVLAALIGAGVLALPLTANAVAATPFSTTDTNEDSADVPDTIDQLTFTAARDASRYTFTVGYDDLAKTATTQRFAGLIDTSGDSKIKGNLIELRTNRKSEVSVHFYKLVVSKEGVSIDQVPCQGLAVSPSYGKDVIRYSMPRACYAGSDQAPGAQVTAQDSLYNDETWNPAATFSTDGNGSDPDATDSIGGTWTFKPGPAPKAGAPVKLPFMTFRG